MITSRREFLKTSGAGAVLAGAAWAAEPGLQKGRRPNIVLFVTDDQSDAGCYGNTVVKTPALDRLAAEGIRFTHAFCTTPSCSPSRSVILTGRHNHATGQYGLAHPYHHFVSFENQATLPKLLQDSGYRTIHAGKYHVAPKETFAFEEFFNFEFKDHKTSIDMAEAIQPVIEKEDNRPFFLYFCTREPHRPFQRSHADPVNPGEVRVPPFLPDTDECRKELAEYYMSCHEADLALGKVLDAIKASGHWDDTVIIWIADNGLPFPGAKTSLYEPGVRLPCVIRHPELTRKNATNQAMINWCDLTPTLLDIAHATPEKAQYHGRSLLPILETESPGGWDEVYFSHTFHEVTMYYPVRGYRDRRYKFLWNLAHPLEFPFARDLWDSETWQGVLKRGDTHYGNRSVEALLHRPEFELYDLEQDPWETTNLALQEEFKSHATSFHQKVREFQERTEDPWVIKWKHE